MTSEQKQNLTESLKEEKKKVCVCALKDSLILSHDFSLTLTLQQLTTNLEIKKPTNQPTTTNNNNKNTNKRNPKLLWPKYAMLQWQWS